jgi:hypothetical protein
MNRRKIEKETGKMKPDTQANNQETREMKTNKQTIKKEKKWK